MSVPTADDIMARKLISLRPEQRVSEAIDILLRRKISGAPVLDGSGTLVGVLSERDCLKLLANDMWHQEGTHEATVGDFMTKEVMSITPQTDIFAIAGIFLSKPIRRLPVVAYDGRLVGQVSRRDVLRAIETLRADTHKDSRRSFPDYRRPH